MASVNKNCKFISQVRYDASSPYGVKDLCGNSWSVQDGNKITRVRDPFGGNDGLRIDSINRTKVHLPPYDEQIMIANYLKEKCSRIDAVIAKKEVAINKSTEYKKSLIYEAVTGKLEV